MFPSLFHELAKNFGFRTVFKPPKDGKWGGIFPNGSHMGLVGQLSRGEVDVCPSSLTVTHARSAVVDFVQPTVSGPFFFVSRKNERQSLNLWVYFDSFSRGTWICLSLLSLAGYLLYSLISTLSENWKSEGGMTLLDFVFFYQSTLDVGQDKNYKMTLRVLSLSVAFCSVVAFAAYNALLVTNMTIIPKPKVISGLQDFLDGDFQPIIFENGVIHSSFKHAKPNSLMSRVFKAKIEGNAGAFYANTKEELNYLETIPDTVSITLPFGSVDPEKYHIIPAPEVLHNQMAFAFPKGSELAPLFNHFLFKLDQTGAVDKLMRKWVHKDKPLEVFEETTYQAHDLGFENVAFPFVYLAVGFGTSFAIICYEKLKRLTDG